jgi:hypothetical protein
MFDYTQLKSVMADRPADHTSDRYSFIPTKTVINLLDRHGWYVNHAREANSKKHAGFQKHVIRFRRTEDLGRKLEVDEIVTEAILKTAHDGTTQFDLGGGFQRCWCDNQCTVDAGTVAKHRIKHIGYTDGAVLNAINSIAKDMPKISQKMMQLKSIEVNSNEKFIFANQALDLIIKPEKWETYNKAETIKKLLKPKRFQDQSDNLWNLFNIVQEKLIKGDRYLISNQMVRTFDYYGRDMKYANGEKVRGITSIDRDSKVNEELWSLAESTIDTVGIY